METEDEGASGGNAAAARPGLEERECARTSQGHRGAVAQGPECHPGLRGPDCPQPSAETSASAVQAVAFSGKAPPAECQGVRGHDPQRTHGSPRRQPRWALLGVRLQDPDPQGDAGHAPTLLGAPSVPDVRLPPLLWAGPGQCCPRGGWVPLKAL